MSQERGSLAVAYPLRSPIRRGCGVGRRITGVRLREATWREWALDAEDACLRAPTPRTSPNAARIGVLLGRIRDLEAEWTQDAVEWITTENATLKQRVRQLSTDNRTLDERLTAPRSGLRFQDRRIADLEARLNEQCKTYLSANSQSETSENRSIFVRASADGHIP